MKIPRILLIIVFFLIGMGALSLSYMYFFYGMPGYYEKWQGPMPKFPMIRFYPQAIYYLILGVTNFLAGLALIFKKSVSMVISTIACIGLALVGIVFLMVGDIFHVLFSIPLFASAAVIFVLSALISKTEYKDHKKTT